MNDDRLRRCGSIKVFIADNAGVTLVELIVVMAIFIIVIIVTSGAFERILSGSTNISKSAESNIEGIVGLEIMRIDLESAGFGMPYEMNFVADFDESQVATDYLAPGINPQDFNDKKLSLGADPNKIPRAVQSKKAATTGVANARDYLVIKSTAIGMNSASGKWGNIVQDPAKDIATYGYIPIIKKWNTTTDLAKDDRVITMTAENRRLVGTGMSNFSYTLTESGGSLVPDSSYKPQSDSTSDSDNYLVYGVSSTSNLSFPYNRVDYYIKTPADISPRCASGSGILYKAVLNQVGGGVTQYPLLECVADMQVVYSLDTSPDDTLGVDLHVNEDGLAGLTAKEIRQQLKEIRVYLLTQDGVKDSLYKYPTSTILVGETFGNIQFGRLFDLTQVTDWARYRWKIYKLVIRPKNF